MKLVLPGFHPDPSVCRVGDDYYLVTSSFEYFPAIPVFHSVDLEQWDPVAAVFPDPSFFTTTPGIAGASTGFYAPTLRFHDGSFFVVTTSRGDFRRGQVMARADDPCGPWSEPAFIANAVGIDPDLAWDETGTAFLTWRSEGGISQARIDVDEAVLLDEPRVIWMGTGLGHPEGPHLYRREGWWYLVIAEGGTGRGHCVSVARSRSITGPFESMPANPAFTTRSTTSPVQSTGHADLIERVDGTWAAVHLGVRPRGSFPRFHVNGRETFLTEVAWEGHWPVFDTEFEEPERSVSVEDRFDSGSLDLRWVAPSRSPREFARTARSGLELSGGRQADASESQALLCTRVAADAWSAQATVRSGDVALVLRIDDRHWIGVERVGPNVRARMVIGPLDQILGTAPADGPLTLVIRAREPDQGDKGPDQIEVGRMVDGRFEALASVDGRYLSSEVAGGFTGRMIGLEALGGDASVGDFRLEPLQNPVADERRAGWG